MNLSAVAILLTIEDASRVKALNEVLKLVEGTTPVMRSWPIDPVLRLAAQALLDAEANREAMHSASAEGQDAADQAIREARAQLRSILASENSDSVEIDWDASLRLILDKIQRLLH